MSKVYDFGIKNEETETDRYLTEFNHRLGRSLQKVVADFAEEIKERRLVIEGVMGTGINDFVAASVMLLNASYFLNKICGHSLKLSPEQSLDLTFNEVENLGTLLLQRLLVIEKERFEKSFVEPLKATPLFRRIKKKVQLKEDTP